MKLVAVSIVKNEADVIEAFVRHTQRWVDHHLVFDHDSTDGTREVLGELVREGLRLSLFTDDALGNLQQARSNALTQLACSEFGAQWVLPLDADELLVAPDRAALETALGSATVAQAMTVPLVNYYPTEQDEAAVANPFERLRYRASLENASRKVMVPAALATDRTVTAGKGSHALYRGEKALDSRAGPPGVFLAHFALRSLGQQVLRVATAELQKVSRGQAHAGLDVHYRLGFQLLAEQPELFAKTLHTEASRLTLDPVPYCGGALRYAFVGNDWMRVARALLPFLEKLARSHGELIDRTGGAAKAESAGGPIRSLAAAAIQPARSGNQSPFDGFEVVEGLGGIEGPYAEAFLPPFRWGLAPQTVLRIACDRDQTARLKIVALTYWENQLLHVELDGAEVHRLAFPRVHQKEHADIALPLQAGVHTVALRYDRFHASVADPRQLAVIFLSLRVEAPAP